MCFFDVEHSVIGGGSNFRVVTGPPFFVVGCSVHFRTSFRLVLELERVVSVTLIAPRWRWTSDGKVHGIP
jgi:hypothetical protein